ncbi:MAG: response regulator [Chitinivibrionales bacterium]|nr:response regulator [Chitinivibrionales bacterium]
MAPVPSCNIIPCSFTELRQRINPQSHLCRILVMDDEEIIRMTFSKLLTMSGYEVTAVSSGEQAIETYRKAFQNDEPFDLVILDMTVPYGMGGIEATCKLRLLNREVKVVITSGFSHDPIMDNYAEYGFAGAIKKPFDMADLNHTIQSIVFSDNAI